MHVDASAVVAVIPTRGDCDLGRILDGLIFGEVQVWDNTVEPDAGAFGRYLALARSHRQVVYFQDDDAVVPEAAQRALLAAYEPGLLTVNMPAEHGLGHPLLALPGWGSIFDRGLPAAAFERWFAAGHPDDDDFRRIGADIVFPVLTPSTRHDFGHEDLPHAHAAGRTHRRADYLPRKQWFYETAAMLRR